MASTKQTRNDRLIVIARLGVVLSFASSCWGYPIIDINFAFDNGGPFRLSANKCAWFNGVPRVERVVIRLPHQKPFEKVSVLCGLEVADRSKDWPHLTRWTYGQAIEGFRLVGPCEPLKPGSYRVDVHGTGAGSRVINIGDDGRWQEESPHCNP